MIEQEDGEALRARWNDPEDEIAALNRNEVVKTALRLLRQTTKLRIALVARVTPSSWTACVVLDDANFGLKAGDELELSTTY